MGPALLMHMKLSLVAKTAIACTLTSAFLPSAHASALAIRDKAARTITIKGRMVYSGEAYTPGLADLATQEIQTMWSEPAVTAAGYKILFDVSEHDAREGMSPRPGSDASCAYNFIELRNLRTPGDRSYYTDLGSQYGVFYTSDDIGRSTTAAHEFGHGLMLDHDPSNQLAAPIPGIMFARGTLVRPEFQWDPNADPGARGGTLNPRFRKVRAEDVNAIPLRMLSDDHIDVECIGMGLVKRVR